MFQVEPILWLQQHGGPVWRAAMEVVSQLGRSGGYAAALIVLAFVVRRRPAIALVFVMLGCAVVIDTCKEGFAMPRPEHVDARVVGTVDAVVPRGGAPGPLAALPDDTVAATRATSGLERGFPSGHVASATAFALGVRWLMPWRGATWFAALWIPLMAVSRLSLGKHFVGDVLGGFVLGAAAAWIGARVSLRLEQAAPAPDRARWILVAVGVAALLAAALGVGNTPRMLGSLAGVAIATAVALRWAPAESGVAMTVRWARVGLAAAIYAGGTVAAAAIAPDLGPLGQAVGAAIPVGLALVIPLLLVRRRVE